jgi:carbon storage regulator CsrA
MLCLTRKKDETIICTYKGIEIKIKALRIEPNRVTLGITAPDDVVIMREEAKEKRNGKTVV